MKRIIIFIFVISSFQLIMAQDDDGYHTISDNGKTRFSGFGGPIMNFTTIDGNFVHMMGGGGGIIINGFFFGGYGMGKTNEIVYKGTTSTSDQVMDFGHGGLWFGYTFFYNKPVHPVIHTTVGWGGINKRQKTWDGNIDYEYPDQVFLICPTAELEFNFSRFFKLGAGLTYSFVYGSEYPYSINDFDNAGIFVSFKFGWF